MATLQENEVHSLCDAWAESGNAAPKRNNPKAILNKFIHTPNIESVADYHCLKTKIIRRVFRGCRKFRQSARIRGRIDSRKGPKWPTEFWMGAASPINQIALYYSSRQCLRAFQFFYFLPLLIVVKFGLADLLGKVFGTRAGLILVSEKAGC